MKPETKSDEREQMLMELTDYLHKIKLFHKSFEKYKNLNYDYFTNGIPAELVRIDVKLGVAGIRLNRLIGEL